MGIISGSGSFRGRLGDHFRVGDHFGVGIISGAVQIATNRAIQVVKTEEDLKTNLWRDWVRSDRNMAAKGVLERGITAIWQKLLTVVNNALVYLDSRTAEWIHWCGNLQDLIDAGALNVCDIASQRVSSVNII